MGNQPVFKTFAQGVQVLVWENETTYKKGDTVNVIKTLKVKPENTYLDAQGLRKKTDSFEIEKLPLLISSLQKIYERYFIKCYDNGKEVKDMYL